MNNKQWSTPPKMTIDPKKHYAATMETSKGTIEPGAFTLGESFARHYKSGIFGMGSGGACRQEDE